MNHGNAGKFCSVKISSAQRKIPINFVGEVSDLTTATQIMLGRVIFIVRNRLLSGLSSWAR
jgi:hypothetical protein